MGSLMSNQKKVGTLPLTLPLTLLGNQKKVSTLTLILTLVPTLPLHLPLPLTPTLPLTLPLTLTLTRQDELEQRRPGERRGGWLRA